LWLATIAMFSGRTFAASNTSNLLARLLTALQIVLDSRQFLLLHVFIRKSAHFFAYALLSALFFRAWRGSKRKWRWTWTVLALLVCLFTASSDEYHQYFTAGRTGLATDVVLDMAGSLFAQLMIVSYTARRQC
jgi:VanZ family protein